jgi:hypothetical protein
MKTRRITSTLNFLYSIDPSLLAVVCVRKAMNRNGSFFMFCVLCAEISSSFYLFLLFLISFLFVSICRTPPVVCCYFIIMYPPSPPPLPTRTHINLVFCLQSIDLYLPPIRWRFFPFKYLCLNLYSVCFVVCFLVFLFLYTKSCPP